MFAAVTRSFPIPTYIRVFPFAFKGGAHDAPAGQMGPVNIMFDVWFRQDGDRFAPVAVFGIWEDVDHL